MNRNELMTMQYYAREIAKLIYKSEECTRSYCNNCGYHAVCQATKLLHDLIEHECDNYAKER